MKKLTETMYWIIFIIYEELIFSNLVFGKFPNTFLWIILLSLPFALTLDVITSITQKKVNIPLSYIITFGVCFIVAAQLIYYKIYEAILSIFSIFNGGQVTEFMTTIIDKMQENWQGLVLIFIPFIILILLKIFKIVEFRKKSLKEITIKIITTFAIYLIGIICINTIQIDSIYSNKNLYYNLHVPKLTANKMGLYTAMKLDLKRIIFGFEENLSIETVSIQEEQRQEEKKFNITEINFDELIRKRTK